jgi:hypothetical protein
VDKCAEILRRVAGRFLALISMSALLITILTTVVGAVVGALIKSVLGSKALRQAAAGTPAMAEAAQTYAERVRDWQHFLHDFELWSYQISPRGKIGKVERPALKAIEPPQIEDPAA